MSGARQLFYGKILRGSFSILGSISCHELSKPIKERMLMLLFLACPGEHIN